MNEATAFILAHELDEAGVEHWQRRLRDARRRGPDAYTREWREIVAEYRQRTGGRRLEVVE